MFCRIAMTRRPHFRGRASRKVLKKCRAEILAGRAVLVLFQGGEVANQDAALLSEGLYLAHKSSGDVIYTAQP